MQNRAEIIIIVANQKIMENENYMASAERGLVKKCGYFTIIPLPKVLIPVFSAHSNL